MQYKSNDLLLPSGNKPIRIGSNIIVELLGTGGMAKVYKVWNEKLEIYRAIKILHPSNQKIFLKGFETEAKISAKLNHSNIVKVYNIGEWNNLYYMEMELVEGITLQALITRYGKLPVEIVSTIAIQIANALSYAHNQEYLIYGKIYKGIIHRDLKPANIMISNEGELKLMDFGIAGPKDEELHTQDGVIIGTLQYLSPEQLKNAPVDNRTDIYSLGTIIYEILTGIRTFPQLNMDELINKKITNKYKKLEELDLTINPDLIEITNTCLKIKKEERPNSSEILLDKLIEFHKSISADPPDMVLKKFINSPETINIFTSYAKIKKYKQDKNEFNDSYIKIESSTDDLEFEDTTSTSEAYIDVSLDLLSEDNQNSNTSELKSDTINKSKEESNAFSKGSIKEKSNVKAEKKENLIKEKQNDFESVNNKNVFFWPELISPAKNKNEKNSEIELFYNTNTTVTQLRFENAIKTNVAYFFSDNKKDDDIKQEDFYNSDSVNEKNQPPPFAALPEQLEFHDDSSLSTSPAEADLHFEKGWAEFEAKRYSEALKCIKAACELEPENKMFRANLKRLLNLINPKKDENKYKW
ncbi:MAG: protein kinase [Chitinispirillia bacterium]|jgi:serine/threonine protein kinase